MATAPLVCQSVAEFLRLDECTFNKRLEFHDGKVLELESATPYHSVLCSASSGILRSLFPPSTGCLVMDGSLNIYAESFEMVLKPDAAVVCGEMLIIKGLEGIGAAIRNPHLVVEVLSPKSANYDKGEKSDVYRSLFSLQHYIVVAQDRVRVQHYALTGVDRWELTEWGSLSNSFPLGAGLFRLGDLYEGLDIS